MSNNTIMQLIIISGSPATGKTTLATQLAKELGYGFCSKDALKERLFDRETVNTRRFLWYETRAKAQFFSQIQEAIQHDRSLIIESDFNKKDRERLRALLTKKVHVTEIYCYTKGFTSLVRFIRRNENGTRHRGHHDRHWYASMFLYNVVGLTGRHWPYLPLRLTSSIHFVDTTHPSLIPIEAIVSYVRKNKTRQLQN